MNGEYLKLKVRQIENIIIIKVVNIPEYASVNKTLISMPLGNNKDDRDNHFFLSTSSSYHHPEIIDGISCGLILPIPEDNINEMGYSIIINFTSYEFDSEEEANTYLCNLSKAIKLYNEHIRYKEANNGYIATNEWMVIQ